MKRTIFIFTTLLFLGTFSAIAQEKDKSTGQKVKGDLKSDGQTVGTEAKKVGNKTAEIAAKGKAKVVDKTYKGKTGPKGQTIYIDKESRYYWLDKKGHRQFISESRLKDKQG